MGIFFVHRDEYIDVMVFHTCPLKAKHENSLQGFLLSTHCSLGMSINQSICLAVDPSLDGPSTSKRMHDGQSLQCS